MSTHSCAPVQATLGNPSAERSATSRGWTSGPSARCRRTAPATAGMSSPAARFSARSHCALRASRTAAVNGPWSAAATMWMVLRMTQPCTTSALPSAAVRSAFRNPAERDHMPTYPDGACWVCSPHTCAATFAGGPAARSSSNCRASSARLSARAERTGADDRGRAVRAMPAGSHPTPTTPASP